MHTAIMARMRNAVAWLNYTCTWKARSEPETLLEIDPSLTREEIDAATAYTDFAGISEELRVGEPAFLKSPEDYARVARRLFERLASEGVTYAEVTSIGGRDFVEAAGVRGAIYDALQREAARSSYQGPWILDAIRQFGPEPAKPVFDLAAERVGEGVVAIGIGRR